MVILVIPVYYGSDDATANFLAEHRAIVHSMTGHTMRVVLESIDQPRIPDDISSAVNSERFPGLRFTDIPCLWIEGAGASFIVPLPDSQVGVSRVFKQLVDSFRHANTFADGQMRFEKLTASNTESNRVSGAPTVTARPTLISLHGIRTHGKWQKDIQESCNVAGVDHLPISFGWFGALMLLFPPARNRKVEWFREQYEGVMKTRSAKGEGGYPSIIAHSFGTYIVATAMEKHSLIRFDQIIFCGAIVRRDFDWTGVHGRGQFVRVLNDYGQKDLPVRIAEWAISDAGSSGYQGFENNAGGSVVQRKHEEYGHSTYFTELNFNLRWLPFVTQKMDPELHKELAPKRLNRRFSALVFILVGLIAFATWWFV